MGLVVVIDGPNGAGKDTIRQRLIEKYPHIYQKFANTTTREKRLQEVEGESYFFVNEKEMRRKIAEGEVFEHTVRYNAIYGMSKKAIEDIWAKGKVAINNCDILGIRAVKELYGDNALSLFIKASKDEVRQRMIKRGESAEAVEMRMAKYDDYMAVEKELDFSVENNDLEKAVEKVHKIIQRRLKG